MSDDRNQDGSELKASITPESSTDAANTPQGDEEQTKTSVAEFERDRQIKVWAGRIASGEKTIDDIPAGQQWLKPLVSNRLEAKTQPAPQDIEKIVEAKLAEKEVANRVKALEANLSKDKLAVFQAEFKDLRDSGVPSAKALEKAMKIAGTVDMELLANEDLRRGMALPKASYYQDGTNPNLDIEGVDSNGIMNTQKLSEADRLKAYRKMMQG